MTIPNTYGKIISLAYAVPPHGTQETISVALGFYGDKGNSGPMVEPFKIAYHDMPIDFTTDQRTNLKHLIYDYLKTLPQYAGAVDA